MCIGVESCDRNARMMISSTSAFVYERSATISFFAIVLLFLRLPSALFAVFEVRVECLRTATGALFQRFAFFLRNPPKRAFFFGCTRWIVFIASLAKACVRLIARRSARG